MKNNLARMLLACVLGFCAFAVIMSCIGYPKRQIEESSVIEETTEIVESTTEETTTTTTTTATETTLTSETATTKRLMYYDILSRIDMITMLLDQADYQRLIDKPSDELTTDERVELQYYSCLVFERKQLREYLSKLKEDNEVSSDG